MYLENDDIKNQLFKKVTSLCLSRKNKIEMILSAACSPGNV